MNIITQNSMVNLERISAYDTFCLRGERLSMLRFVLCVVLIVAMAVARIWLWVSVFYCNVFLFVCFLSTLIWKLVDDAVLRNGKKSAQFIQLMQCELLGTRWNHYLCGEKPLPEEVFVNIKQPIEQYKNRYPKAIEMLPENRMVLSCFYLDSIRYARLRTRHIRWCNWMFGIAIGSIILSSFFVTASNWNAILLYVIAPSVPLTVWYSAVREKHRNSSEQMQMIQQMIHDAVASDFTSANNDLIQDNLFLYNKDVYQIPRILEGRKLKKETISEQEYVVETMMKNKGI